MPGVAEVSPSLWWGPTSVFQIAAGGWNCEQSPPGNRSEAASPNDPLGSSQRGRLFSSSHTELCRLPGWYGWWDRAGDAPWWQEVTSVTWCPGPDPSRLGDVVLLEMELAFVSFSSQLNS